MNVILNQLVVKHVGAAAALAVTFGFDADSANAQADKDQGLRVVEVVNSGDDEVNQTIEVRIDNGEVSAKVNGKEVPADRIRKEDGRVIILDENGNPINNVNVAVDRDGLLRYYVGAGAPEGMFRAWPDQQANPPRVMMGVHLSAPGRALEKHLGLEENATTMLSGVFEGLSAHDAGLEEFDIIVKINGKSPADSASIMEELGEMEPGETVELDVIREGKKKQVKVKLQKYDAEALKKSTLLGQAAQGEPFLWNFGDQGMWQGFKLPDMREHLFVAPELKDWQSLQPEVREKLRKHLDQPRGESNIDEQLERLDQRMAELEAMLERLVERQEKNR